MNVNFKQISEWADDSVLVNHIDRRQSTVNELEQSFSLSETFTFVLCLFTHNCDNSNRCISFSIVSNRVYFTFQLESVVVFTRVQSRFNIGISILIHIPLKTISRQFFGYFFGLISLLVRINRLDNRDERQECLSCIILQYNETKRMNRIQ